MTAFDNRHPDARMDVVSLVDTLLSQAVTSRATDIHFEPTAEGLVIKFRLDGLLVTRETLPKVIADNCVSRLKVLGGLLTYRNDIPQEGRIESADGVYKDVMDLRLAIFPTIHGQRAVVRVLYQNDQLVDLEQLGFPTSVLGHLQDFAHRSQGILLLTGPAGTGKSTTLGALMRTILKATPGRSIVTLEDPVEIRIPGVTQVQITPHGAMTFPVALRSLLRQDPQVLMIGEIRDAETARIGVEAGLTGHLLATTLHSGTPAGALLRLLEMGIEPYQVTSSICAVINQRLVRRLCDHCKRAQADQTFDAAGCDHCLHTGYTGRILLAEAIELDRTIRQAVLNRADLEDLEMILATQGRDTMAIHAERLISQGKTSKPEIARVLGYQRPTTRN
ncbi:MAG: type II/IV secretion system protein [Planctomycetes bacterium]|nr:type II/IV secretion system protein [Planctomycetota bacterium]